MTITALVNVDDVGVRVGIYDGAQPTLVIGDVSCVSLSMATTERFVAQLEAAVAQMRDWLTDQPVPDPAPETGRVLAYQRSAS